MKNLGWLTIIFFFPAITCINSPKYFSGYGQDKYVHKTFFKHKKHGIFVDLGAYDGIRGSNTYFFEKNLGWTGICVEPIPETFSLLQKNRDCICLNICVADYTGKGKFWKLPEPFSMGSGLAQYYHPLHMKDTDRILQKARTEKESMEVEVDTLTNILEKYKVFHIDFLSIDTEDSELAILQATDFSKFNISVIVLENNRKNKDIGRLLREAGYQFVTRLGGDDVYKKNGFTGKK